jgi:hypothetical protein
MRDLLSVIRDRGGRGERGRVDAGLFGAAVRRDGLRAQVGR